MAGIVQVCTRTPASVNTSTTFSLAGFATRTEHAGHWNEYVVSLVVSHRSTCTWRVVSSMSPQVGQLALTVATVALLEWGRVHVIHRHLPADLEPGPCDSRRDRHDWGVATHRSPLALPLGFAHRGARAEARDNTLASFRRALDLGATALESDAWVTVEGTVVLDHDGLVRRGLRHRPISALAVADLPAHIPTLTQLWAECGTAFHLSLDIKDPAAACAVLAEAEAADTLERVWLCSPRPELLPEWRSRSDRVRLVLSTRRDRLDGPTIGSLPDLGVDAVNLRDREWDADLVGAVHDVGLLSFGWDAQREDQLERLMELGVDGVYSDHVGRMLAALGRQDR
jgi:glycerophosphoryl diester phosphodiesterase